MYEVRCQTGIKPPNFFLLTSYFLRRESKKYEVRSKMSDGNQTSELLPSYILLLTFLFPFNRRWRFAADVVDDSVYAFDFVDDASGDAGKQIVGEVGPVGGHEVVGGYAADGDDVVIRAGVAHDADAL